MHSRRGLSASFGMALLGLLASMFIACTGQGENERCDLRNGSADCNDGLQCTPFSGLGAPICCPPDPAQRTGLCAGQSTTTDSGTSSETDTTDSGST